MKLKNLLIFIAVALCQTVLAQQREHTVERGETLASIAKKYGVSEGQLKAANPNMTMCFAGVRLVIPDPNAPTASEAGDADDSSAIKHSKSDEKKDTTSHKGGFNKLIKSAGKTLGKAAKVTGSVATAVVVTKLKGGSYFDAINNAIDAADSTLSGKKSDYGLTSLLSRGDVKKAGKVAREQVTDLVDQAKENGKAAVKEGIEGVVATVDPELEKLYEEYKAKYNEFVSQMEKVKAAYMKANTVAKQRTWKTVSDAAKDYKTQLEKLRTECEMYTGHAITAASVESWVPISPKR